MRPFVLTLLLAVAVAAQETAPDAARFRARDAHQGVSIAVAPVTDEAAAAAAFGKDVLPPKAGVVAVEFLIVNERAEAVRIALERIVLETDDARFEQVAPDDVAYTLYPLPETTAKDSPRAPAKLPRDKNRSKRELALAELRRSQLRAELVAAGGRARGFRYFRVRGQALDLARARVYIPDVVVAPTGEALLYFEIELKPYAKP